ncbi:hypothetical protein FB45DRAFT_113085 [Roridomyces roridus]|uniref:Uncharacterized protein n=1 Tax=Roridomyces roridus TaxID=1738132 RepID=A0AAD7FK82_9AGAR|nr:hypothetical protein FB45DRAFT_113085 [Roridomyces roridus]
MSSSTNSGSSPVRRRIAILAVSSLVSCIFFSAPMFRRIPIRNQLYDSKIEYEPPIEPVAVTVTVHAPKSIRTNDVNDLVRSEETLEFFKDRLRPELRYITSWATQDWNSQVLGFMNLMYLALITERVAIIPPFPPFVYNDSVSPGLEFGEVFDMTRLQNGMRKPVLEWHQVKDPLGTKVEVLGCWGNGLETWKLSQYLNLDVSYTVAPNWTLFRPEEPHMSFWALASLAFPDSEQTENAEPSRMLGIAVKPEQQLLCFDDLSLASARNPREYSQEMSPAWRFVGRHMHWSARLQYIADLYTQKACGVGSEDPIPPYIAIYARYSDPSSWCDLPVEECFPPLFMYARRVQELKAEIRETMGIEVNRVIMTADDEMESIWWEAVQKRGWSRLDHSRTVERYGLRYPLLIDAVVRSGALGFVTADDSVTSVLAIRRVFSWQGGFAKRVPWETKLRQKP